MNPLDQRITTALARHNFERHANDELHDEMADIIKDMQRRLSVAHAVWHILKHSQGAVTRPDCRKDVDKLYRATDLKQEFML